MTSENTAQTPSQNMPMRTIEAEMQRSYLDYAMSVIVSRALPDVRDGLKPVHRRILYAMKEGGYDSGKPYKKSARIVGDVMGKFHPHGDSAIYDAMVRMVQDFSMRLPLIDGQGNFGSMDDDPAAAMRYTEARLAKSAEINLDDIDKDTVDFQPNYDESEHEPKVLPARFPNLLVNGANGIAVGMATNIPPHNLGEVVDACLAYLDNPAIGIDELIAIIPGPDFPTGAQIMGRGGAHAMYNVGRGSIRMRGRTEIEEIRKDKTAIIITEIPYQVNKRSLIERIAECVNTKIIEGISDIRDESDQSGVRVVIELKRDAQPDVVLNQLYKFTPLQTSFGANMLALHKGRPERLTLRDFIAAFIEFREETLIRRTKFELMKARERAHILIGLAVAVANIDEIIALIRSAPNPETAREQLMARNWSAEPILPLLARIGHQDNAPEKGTYKLSEIQAKAILDLRLHRLTGLERDKIADDLNGVVGNIEGLLYILNNRPALLDLMRTELTEVKDKFATPRRTEIMESDADDDIEDLIPREDMVVTISHAGYIKRVPLATYRAQKRGGKGRSGVDLKENDAVIDLYVANTHTTLLCFTTRGIVHALKVYKLPLGNPQARGKALINLLPVAQDEKISVIMPLPDGEGAEKLNILFATSHGTVRRNRLEDFMNIRSNGLIAMKLGEGENLIGVETATNDQDILLISKQGKAIRFPVDNIRVFAGRASTGVRGMSMNDSDEIMSLSIITGAKASVEDRDVYLKIAGTERRLSDENPRSSSEAVAQTNKPLSFEQLCIEASASMDEKLYQQLKAQEQFILTISDRGFGKRTSAYEYRQAGRGGQGIAAMAVTDKTGQMVAAFPVQDDEHIMLVSDQGQLIRTHVHDVRIAGRATQGVTLFRVDANEHVVSVATLREESDSEAE